MQMNLLPQDDAQHWYISVSELPIMGPFSSHQNASIVREDLTRFLQMRYDFNARRYGSIDRHAFLEHFAIDSRSEATPWNGFFLLRYLTHGWSTFLDFQHARKAYGASTPPGVTPDTLFALEFPDVSTRPMNRVPRIYNKKDFRQWTDGSTRLYIHEPFACDDPYCLHMHTVANSFCDSCKNLIGYNAPYSLSGAQAPVCIRCLPQERRHYPLTTADPDIIPSGRYHPEDLMFMPLISPATNWIEPDEFHLVPPPNPHGYEQALAEEPPPDIWSQLPPEDFDEPIP